jgi:hypothetical protein
LLLALGLLAAAFFAYAYVTDPGRPGELEPLGWFGADDQGAYLQLAKDLAHFRLPEGDFTYGIGYPLLAVPSIWLGLDYDPFALADGLVFVFVAMATYVTALRMSGGSRVVAGIAGYGLVFASPLVWFVDKPWNSTASLFAASVILLLATSPTPRPWHPVAMGLAVGLGFAARYVDVIWLAALAAAGILAGRRAVRTSALLTATGSALLVVGLVLVAHGVVLGSVFDTPYGSHLSPVAAGSDQDLGSYDITKVPEGAFGEFVSPFLLGQRFGGQPFLQGMFWSLLAIPGAVLVLRRRARWRLLVAAIAAGFVASAVFYLSFRGSGPGAVQFGGLHYFKMWWPSLAILAAIGLCAIARWRPAARATR